MKACEGSQRLTNACEGSLRLGIYRLLKFLTHRHSTNKKLRTPLPTAKRLGGLVQLGGTDGLRDVETLREILYTRCFGDEGSIGVWTQLGLIRIQL